MPAFDYECRECKSIIEQQHRVGQAPRTVQCRCGAIAHRIYTVSAVTIDMKPCSSKYPYVSERLPRDAKGCRATGEGKPIIENRQHEDRVLKTLGYERE